MKPNQFWCVGRNYSEHAKELGNAVPDKPLIFLKSGASLQQGSEISFPSYCQDIHHELEIVVLLGKDLKPTHWTLGLDLTERTIQSELKKQGQPWELAKTFKGAAVLGPWQPLESAKNLESMEFRLDVNGTSRQVGHTRDMIFSFPVLMEYLTARFPVSEGDAVFTGTPSGVGPLKSGDKLVASSGQLTVNWSVR